MIFKVSRYRFTISSSQLISFVFLAVCIILAGANTNNPDLHNYIGGYNLNIGISEGGWLYYFSKMVFLKIGASFEIFRLFLYGLGFVIMYIANNRIAHGSSFSFVYYAVSLLMIDSTQTYNFIGMCFLLLGVSYLITAVKYRRIKYLVCLLLASGFHLIFLFYIPFIFIYSRTDKKQLIKIYIGVTAIIFLLSIVVDVTGLANILVRFLDYFNLSTYRSYLVSRTRYGHLIPMMTHLVCCVFTLFYYVKIDKNENLGEVQRICLLLNLFGIFAFPFLRFQLVLGRITRNLTLVTCFSGLDYVDNAKKNSRRNTIICLFILAVVLGYFNTYSSYIEEIVKPFFTNNWILEVFQ